MTSKQAKELLKMSSEHVPFGIFALEKGNQIELMNQKASSRTQLKKMIRDYKSQGFKVYANGL